MAECAKTEFMGVVSRVNWRNAPQPELWAAFVEDASQRK